MSKLSIDMKALRQLAELLDETNLTEIEWREGEVTVRLGRGAGVAAAPASLHVMPPPVADQAPAAAADAPAPAPAQGGGGADEAAAEQQVRSPMVGTAYLSPEPGQPCFVKPGDHVSAGQTLLIIEAMKTMNPLPAPADGVIKAILVENEQPVEFDQPLLVIE